MERLALVHYYVEDAQSIKFARPHHISHTLKEYNSALSFQFATCRCKHEVKYEEIELKKMTGNTSGGK